MRPRSQGRPSSPPAATTDFIHHVANRLALHEVVKGQGDATAHVAARARSAARRRIVMPSGDGSRSRFAHASDPAAPRVQQRPEPGTPRILSEAAMRAMPTRLTADGVLFRRNRSGGADVLAMWAPRQSPDAGAV